MFVSKQDRAVNLIYIKPDAQKYSRVANNVFEFCTFILRASNSLPIALKTISYCQNSHMRIHVRLSRYDSVIIAQLIWLLRCR